MEKTQVVNSEYSSLKLLQLFQAVSQFSSSILAVDTHTAGEPTRIVLSGLPPIPGETMARKKQYMSQCLDHFRTLLIQEPRGHNDMFGCVLTPPANREAHYGAIFLDHSGYLDMCGHGTIGVATALIQLNLIPTTEPETLVVLDTPAGLVYAHAKVEGGRVLEVSVVNRPSFLYAQDIAIVLPEIGEVMVDISFGGNFFAMAKASQLGIPIQPNYAAELSQIGMAVKTAVNAKLQVQHPCTNHIDTVELVEIYDKPSPLIPRAKNVAIFGNGQLDRSPCGTGLSASMAMLHRKGELAVGSEYISESIIGTRFKGRILKETKIGQFVAIEPILIGRAHVTGIQTLLVDPEDALGFGFSLQVRRSSEFSTTQKSIAADPQWQKTA
ncbi:MAG: proline racemase family protein [Xenococcus sp. MO_188.B8]|nr:proline racemase family protein [Xenococcus sp. MO_188.B8]